MPKLCEYENCTKRASYGYKFQKPLRCKEHKLEDMKPQYSICLCGKAYPIYGFPTDKRASCCSKCKTEGMINIKDKKCKAEYCETTGNRKYKGYCTGCFQHLFPLDPLTFQIRCKTKEIATRDFINANYEGFQHDKTLWLNGCDCTHKRRIDHRKLIGGTLLCIETDEHQHKSYDIEDEIKRYNDLAMIHGGKFVFIRFNPDPYLDKKGKRRNPEIKTRLAKLQKEINKHIKRIEGDENEELLEFHKLYYDEC